MGKLFFIKFQDNDYIKQLPLRATRDQLINFIDKIKYEIGYEDIKKERTRKIKNESKDKDLIFARA